MPPGVSASARAVSASRCSRFERHRSLTKPMGERHRARSSQVGLDRQPPSGCDLGLVGRPPGVLDQSVTRGFRREAPKHPLREVQQEQHTDSECKPDGEYQHQQSH